MRIDNLIETEKVLLGSLWIDDKNKYMDIVTEDSFSIPEHKILFNILIKYPEIRVDFILLKLKLTDDKEYFPIAQQLANYARMVSCIDNIPEYVKLLKDNKLKYDIFTLVNSNMGDLTKQEMNTLHKLTTKDKVEESFNCDDFNDLSMNFLDVIDKRKKFFANGFPYPTGLSKLDDTIGGINPGSVIVLGGRTSMGKSSLMTQIACNIASKKKKVVYFTGEMSGQDLFDRIISGQALVEAYKIKYGKVEEYEKERIIKVLSKDDYFKTPLKIYFMPLMTISKISKVIEEVIPEVVFVDHIQLISLEKSDTVAQAISEAMAELKQIAGEMNIGIMVGSQMNRAIEQASSKNKEYSNAYFKSSGGIEENADVAMKLELAEGEKKENIDWNMTLEVTKNRYGRIGPVYLVFQRQYLKFTERNL